MEYITYQAFDSFAASIIAALIPDRVGLPYMDCVGSCMCVWRQKLWFSSHDSSTLSFFADTLTRTNHVFAFNKDYCMQRSLNDEE